jgi:secreted PhoX family phosphatase
VDQGRRQFIKTSLGAPLLAALGGVSIGGLVESLSAAPVPPSTGFGGIGFQSIPPSLAVLDAAGRIVVPLADMVKVPPGYEVQLLASWGDPIMLNAPGWIPNVTQTAQDQAKQFGMHNDGMHFFAYPWFGQPSNKWGLLVVNHEYTHESILHPDGLDELSGGLAGSAATIQKIRKSQAAHGVSVMEIRQTGDGKWHIVKNSLFGRRITANTRMEISGAARGHALMKTKRFNIGSSGSTDTGTITDGTVCWGTANNCANGYTPWGTYLTCEENWNGYFGWKNSAHAQTKLEKRYGVTVDGFTTNVGLGNTGIYKWHVLDDRFDSDINPNGPNTFGWVVEIDPWNPWSIPVKRTSMGRAKWECASFAEDPDTRRIAFYQGDDERNEYLYKFVCRDPYNPNNRFANRDMLDHGTLYVAKFTDQPGTGAQTYRGVWIPLVPDTTTVIDDPANPGQKLKLRGVAEFAGANDAEVQALICIKARMAADAVGATMMDRPEWAAPRPRVYGYTKMECYLTLTNNNRRGSTPVSSNNPDGSASAGGARPAVDVANPRPDNDYGHIIRWREDGDTVTATAFEWDIFVQCGDTRAASHVPSAKILPVSGYNPAGHDAYAGNINDVPGGSADFGAPDGLWFDYYGRLWIQTDQFGDGTGDFQKVGSNTMLCADPNTKEIVRFLTSPPQCEVTGVAGTPDGKTMFVGIQHPGEEGRAANPTQFSEWPKSQFGGPGGRPRSSVLAITRSDGGVIGT